MSVCTVVRSADSIILGYLLPGVRYAYPGLYAAVRSADSLPFRIAPEMFGAAPKRWA